MMISLSKTCQEEDKTGCYDGGEGSVRDDGQGRLF